jgi:hypothetical protein
LQPRIYFDFGHVFQRPQSPLLGFGLLILDFLDDLVVDFVLAVLGITAAVNIVGIAGFFADVPDCGSVGLAFLGCLLTLIDSLIPLSLLPKPRLQSGCLENVFISCSLLVMVLICMLSYATLAH